MMLLTISCYEDTMKYFLSTPILKSSTYQIHLCVTIASSMSPVPPLNFERVDSLLRNGLLWSVD